MRGIAFFVLIAAVSFVVVDADASSTNHHQNQQHSISSHRFLASTNHDHCNAVDQCQLCTDDDEKEFEAVCQETGRLQRFECPPPATEDDSVDQQNVLEVRSCKRTLKEEKSAMFRFQIVCLCLGSLALSSVRTQKRLSASLFDQRKMMGASKQRRRNSNFQEEDATSAATTTIELSSSTSIKQQETIPLVQSSSNPFASTGSLEVV